MLSIEFYETEWNDNPAAVDSMFELVQALPSPVLASFQPQVTLGSPRTRWPSLLVVVVANPTSIEMHKSNTITDSVQ